MTVLPKILQVLFWRPNRLYTPVLKDKKLYGIFVSGQFHDQQTIRVFIEHSMYIIFYIFVFVFVALLLSFNPSWNVFITMFVSLILFNFITLTSFYKKISKKICNYFNSQFKITEQVIAREQLGLKLLEMSNDLEFLKSNPKNFIIDLDSIDRIKISAKSSWIMWPETHFGQIKLIFKSTSKTIKSMFFILKEPKYTEIVAVLDKNQVKLESV